MCNLIFIFGPRSFISYQLNSNLEAKTIECDKQLRTTIFRFIKLVFNRKTSLTSCHFACLHRSKDTYMPVPVPYNTHAHISKFGWLFRDNHYFSFAINFPLKSIMLKNGSTSDELPINESLEETQSIHKQLFVCRARCH